jgi:exopolysaccharide biosynthesis polyprenyl glycosylphosphotransferase
VEAHSSLLDNPARRQRFQALRRLHRPRPRPVQRVGEAIQDPLAGKEAVEARDRVFRRMLAYADVLSVCLALLLCINALGDDHLRATTLLGIPLIVLLGKLQGLYDRDELLIRKTTLDEVPQLFQLATFYTLVFWLLDQVLVTGDLGDAQIVVLWLTLFGGMFAGRTVARALARTAAPVERCLFVGDAMAYDRLRTKLEVAGEVRAELVGRLSLQRASTTRGRSTGQDELAELIDWTDAHRVIIEPNALPAQDMLEFVRAAKSVGVRVSLLPRVLDVVGTSIVVDDLDGVTVLGVRRFGLTRSSKLVKRAFDLLGATLALVAVAPLMLVAALAIRLDTRGSVFFRQTRVGRDGQPFGILKFRTMVPGADEAKATLLEHNEAGDGLFKMRADPRITRVGRLLRKTSLDELPQLLNVLRGDMSLVGPRPLVADEDERITGFDRRRLSLTPGMTGPWQVLGATRAPLPEMVKLDYLYVAGWSLWRDVKILLRTVPHVLRGRSM